MHRNHCLIAPLLRGEGKRKRGERFNQTIFVQPRTQRQRMRGTTTVPLGRASTAYQSVQMRWAFGPGNSMSYGGG